MFNRRENRTFNYTPRFSGEKDADGKNEDAEKPDFVSKWKANSHLGKRKVKGAMSMRVLILILVLLLICMYVLESKFM
ncbi:hypothetical protein KO566_11170 [Flavobacteriaceae bacterium XHP0103]|uniref:hypothetical protein n=1 Tax=Marixanthotalea marina TaxID=2844359 RepID=UPI002989E9FF|nr:hypothetical protein [Marixanthotalea marina]MBU3822626.1 hypothetical protein [Marixanthotalea marina]